VADAAGVLDDRRPRPSSERTSHYLRGFYHLLRYFSVRDPIVKEHRIIYVDSTIYCGTSVSQTQQWKNIASSTWIPPSTVVQQCLRPNSERTSYHLRRFYHLLRYFSVRNPAVQEHRIIYVDSTIYCGTSVSSRHVRDTHRTKHRNGPGRRRSHDRNQATGKHKRNCKK